MHKLFARQLAKATASTGETDLHALGELVIAAYEEQDRDRERTDCSISLMVDELDQLNRGLECLVEERTAALREREEELRRQNLQFDAAINNMAHALIMFDADARMVICNDRYREMYQLPEHLTRPGTEFLAILEYRKRVERLVCEPDKYVEKVRGIVAEGKSQSRILELPDGRIIAVHNQPMAGGGWVATHEDITERRLAERKIAHMARHDALTDLPNRMLLRDRLAQALSVAHHGEQLAVLYLDLDHFKAVNDTLGHQIGDELLKTVAERLRDTVREVDTVARVGGDEFAILCAGIERTHDAAVLARRIGEAVRAPYDLQGHAVIADTSIGIALAPSDGTDPNELLKNADMALYGAKADGRGTYRFFEPAMDARMKTRRTLELALRQALGNGEFELHYQPLIRLSDHRITCCEALLRWHHPERGMIPPAEFIPVAEEIGLIIPLGEWVLRRGLRRRCTLA